MRRSPPTFQPGGLTRTEAEALNQLARDLYGSLLDRFSAAPPLQVRQGLDGVAYSLGPIETAGGIVTRTTVGSIHSADYGPRPRLNFTEGSNIVIGMADDPTDNEIDITITATAPAGAGITVKDTVTSVTVTGATEIDFAYDINDNPIALSAGTGIASIYLNPADSAHAGYVTTRTQSFAGNKIFKLGVAVEGNSGAGFSTSAETFRVVGLSRMDGTVMIVGPLLALRLEKTAGGLASVFPTPDTAGTLITAGYRAEWGAGGTVSLHGGGGITTIGGTTASALLHLEDALGSPAYSINRGGVKVGQTGTGGGGDTYAGGICVGLGTPLSPGTGISISGGGVVSNTGVISVGASAPLSSSGGANPNISIASPLPVANGGTNSGTALNNNRVMVSSGGAVVEAAALNTGQLLIGSTGALPVANPLTAGVGIAITNFPGAITIATTTVNARLTADVGTAVLTATNITGLSFAVNNGEVWSFECYIRNNKSALTAGIKYAINAPAASTLEGQIEGTTSATTAVQNERISALATLTANAYNTVANADGFIRIAGVVVAGANGTVQIQHAAVTSQTATARANSYITARKIA
jgi:hypothetical protein